MTDFHQYYLIQEQRLLNCSFGIHPLTRIVSKENEPMFIKCVKKFIDDELDVLNGFVVDFNSDFTKMKKFKY